jgi:hypothetical protein
VIRESVPSCAEIIVSSRASSAVPSRAKRQEVYNKRQKGEADIGLTGYVTGFEGEPSLELEAKTESVERALRGEEGIAA